MRGGKPKRNRGKSPPASLPDEKQPEDIVTVTQTEEGIEHIQYSIRRARNVSRLDKYLSDRLGKRMSRNALQSHITEGSVTVNGSKVKPSHRIQPGDLIDMRLPTSRPTEIPPEPIPLDIVYEDDDVLAINKQSNLIVHPARGNWTGTLVNGLAYYFNKDWRDISQLPTNGEVFRPGIVHRLDRDTTGILLVAKTELALYRLGRQFEDRKVEKTYSAIVHGRIRLDQDVIDMPIGKHPKIREKYAVHHDTGRAFPMAIKEAVTRYKVLERLKAGVRGMEYTFVELYPKTGRTHQLRVHMSSIGNSIVGDRLYGGGPLYRSQLEGKNDVAEGLLITRQALHAHTIEFDHPRTEKRMSLTAPWPEDFTSTLDVLRTFGHGASDGEQPAD